MYVIKTEVAFIFLKRCIKQYIGLYRAVDTKSNQLPFINRPGLAPQPKCCLTAEWLIKHCHLLFKSTQYKFNNKRHDKNNQDVRKTIATQANFAFPLFLYANLHIPDITVQRKLILSKRLLNYYGS